MTVRGPRGDRSLFGVSESLAIPGAIGVAGWPHLNQHTAARLRALADSADRSPLTLEQYERRKREILKGEA